MRFKIAAELYIADLQELLNRNDKGGKFNVTGHLEWDDCWYFVVDEITRA